MPAYAVGALLVLYGAYCSTAVASEMDTNWTAFNLKLVNSHIIPSYKALNSAADTLEQSTKELCASPSEAALLAAKSAFNQTMDAWQSIQHVNFGPVEYATRGTSFQFWPDKKNHIGKQLNQLIQSNDAERLGDKFTKTSVSIKGLPALERLLYSDQAKSELDQNNYRCQVLMRVSRNVSEIGIALSSEWQNYMLAQFEDAAQVDGFFEDEIDAATALLKTIVEPLEIIRDLKLKRILGSEFGKQKFKRLESWRSQRSLRNIRLNIEVIEDTLPMLESVLAPEGITTITRQLGKINALLDQIPLPLEESIQTESAYQQLSQLVIQLTALHKSLERAVSKQGIHLGFNSRDGD